MFTENSSEDKKELKKLLDYSRLHFGQIKKLLSYIKNIRGDVDKMIVSASIAKFVFIFFARIFKRR